MPRRCILGLLLRKCPLDPSCSGWELPCTSNHWDGLGLYGCPLPRGPWRGLTNPPIEALVLALGLWPWVFCAVRDHRRGLLLRAGRAQCHVDRCRESGQLTDASLVSPPCPCPTIVRLSTRGSLPGCPLCLWSSWRVKVSTRQCVFFPVPGASPWKTSWLT